MKLKLYIFTFFLATLFNLSSFATDLRGRIVRYNPQSNGYYPLANVRVDIWIYNGVQWVDWSYAVTGTDGMYYFLRFAPWAYFQIQVFGNFYFSQPPLFIQNVPLMDIPQIVT